MNKKDRPITLRDLERFIKKVLIGIGMNFVKSKLMTKKEVNRIAQEGIEDFRARRAKRLGQL